MGVLGSLRKSWRLRRTSKLLSGAADPSQFLVDLESDGPSRFDRGVDELLTLSESDPTVRRVMSKHGADRARLRETFLFLLSNGAGQWVGGHYVAASALVFASTLDFVLTNTGQLPPPQICVLLLEYFERRDVGPVPLQERGPADPKDPLRVIWELEQQAKKRHR